MAWDELTDILISTSGTDETVQIIDTSIEAINTTSFASAFNITENSNNLIQVADEDIVQLELSYTLVNLDTDSVTTLSLNIDAVEVNPMDLAVDYAATASTLIDLDIDDTQVTLITFFPRLLDLDPNFTAGAKSEIITTGLESISVAPLDLTVSYTENSSLTLIEMNSTVELAKVIYMGGKYNITPLDPNVVIPGPGGSGSTRVQYWT